MASSIEYFGAFMFMFALFRFRIRRQLVYNILLVSFLMSQVSYFTRINPGIDEFSTYIQFVLFIIVFWILFLIPLFHSIIMNFAGVASGIVIQGLFILLFTQTSGQTMNSLIDNVWIASAIQILSSIIHLALARTIVIWNWGFDFVPTSPRSNVRINGTNAILIGIISFAIVISAFLAYIFKSNLNVYVACASIIFILTLPAFIYFSARKDNEDAT